jgi:hypothetical protein
MPRARLTERDQRITTWVARWQPVTGYQVARRLGIAYVIANRRLRSLRDLGYLQYRRDVHELPGIYFVTNYGFQLIATPARAMRANPFQLWGWLAAVDRVIDAELAGETALAPFELVGHALAPQLPATSKGDPLVPDAVLLGPPPVAIYAAVGPGGVLALNPRGRLGQLAHGQAPDATRVQLVADAAARPSVEASFADRDVELVDVDPHYIGGSHTQ